MKKLFVLVVFLLNAICFGQTQELKKIVDVSCGQCKFGMKDKKGCDLAVKIDNKYYFIEGTTIDDHGDAHADDGFCTSIRKAEVIGKIEDNKFKVTYFKLLPITTN